MFAGTKVIRVNMLKDVVRMGNVTKHTEDVQKTLVILISHSDAAPHVFTIAKFVTALTTAQMVKMNMGVRQRKKNQVMKI